MLDAERVRTHVYDVTLATGRPPLIREIGAALNAPEPSVAATLVDLSSRRILVLQPSGELLMVPPFSAVPTPFVVSTGSFSAYVNCAWDALGAAVMLKRQASISASCADCGQELRLESDSRTVQGGAPLLHFPLPPRRWWEAIVFT